MVSPGRKWRRENAPSVMIRSGLSWDIWMSRWRRQAEISSGRGVPVGRWAALQYVGDIDLGPVQSGFRQELVEQPAGGADEGESLLVLVGPGGFAYEHYPCVGGAVAGDGVGPGFGEGTGGAGAGQVLGELEGVFGRHLLPLGGQRHVGE